MEDWIFKSQNLIMNSTISHKTETKLIQNCDLPPPMNLFIGPNQATVFTSVNSLPSTINKPVKHDDHDHEFNLLINSGESEKLGILKALRFSQTRAREAEEAKTKLAKENDCVCNALMKDSMKLFAYRQQVWLLELEVVMLKRENEEKRQRWCSGCDRWRDENDGGVKWTVLALALCLGITFYYLF